MTKKRNRQFAMFSWISILSVSILASSAYGQADEPPVGVPYSPFPDKVVVTKVKHFDVMTWKIATAGGTWYFENGETGGMSGFDSAFDQAGNDWIGNDKDGKYNKSPSAGGKHEYRGWPNFGEGNFDHPQRASGTKTRWVDEAGKDVPFVDKLEGDHLIMRSANATYELEYHFFVSHAAIKVIKADNKYAFLFEGPVGGEQEASIEKDYYVLKDGKNRECKELGIGGLDPEFKSLNKFPSPFFYLVDSDPKDTQVLYIGVKGGAPDTAGDEGWRQGTNMVIFSYGRDEDKRAYTGTAAISVFGFHPKAAGHESISSFIEARLANPFVAAGGGTTPPGTGGASGSGDGGVVTTGGTTGSGDAAAKGGATSSGGAIGSGGSNTTSGGATTSAGGSTTTTSGGITAKGGATASPGGTMASTGGTTTATGGVKAATGGSTGTKKSGDSGGCSFSSSSSGVAGFGMAMFALGMLMLRRRRSSK